MIAVIDYDTGNLRSVANALGRLGAEYRITASPDEIRSAERVLLPGVGEASTAMEKLRERGLVETIRSLTQPVLGICIGVQLLCRRSEEGDAECIGIFDNEVRKFTAEGLKVPNMGWNRIGNLRPSTVTRSPRPFTAKRSAARSTAATSSGRSFIRKKAPRSANASYKTF